MHYLDTASRNQHGSAVQSVCKLFLSSAAIFYNDNFLKSMHSSIILMSFECPVSKSDWLYNE